MLNFITQNIGTVIVFSVLAFVLGAVIYNMYRDKKKGKNSCGCNCGCCPNAQLCHKPAETTLLSQD